MVAQILEFLEFFEIIAFSDPASALDLESLGILEIMAFSNPAPAWSTDGPGFGENPVFHISTKTVLACV